MRSRSVTSILVALTLLLAMPTLALAGDGQAAKTRLRRAMTASGAYWVEKGTYSGFDAMAAEENVPMDWVEATEPSGAEVDIQAAHGKRVLLVSKAGTGRFFALCVRNNRVRFGFGKAFSSVDEMDECTRDHWR